MFLMLIGVRKYGDANESPIQIARSGMQTPTSEPFVLSALTKNFRVSMSGPLKGIDFACGGSRGPNISEGTDRKPRIRVTLYFLQFSEARFTENFRPSDTP